MTHPTKYRYSDDDFLAVVKKYENSALVDEIRIVRDGFLAVQERDGSNTVHKEYTWGLNLGGGIGGLLNLKQGGQNYAYLYDGKGNVEAVLDNTQAVVVAYRYDPFGKLLAKTGSLTQPFGFSTKRYDAQTGLIEYGFRRYAPAIGRWTTRDPLGEAGGINLYAFVVNNPVNWVDPWGMLYAEQYALAGAAIGGSIVAGSSIVIDVATGGLNILATPAEIAAGSALGGAIGYGIGALLDMMMSDSGDGDVCEPGNEIPSLSYSTPGIPDPDDRDPKQDKKLSNKEIKKLKKAGYDIHDLKGGKGASKFDLFKDKQGNIYVKPKSGAGPGDPLGINLYHL